MFMHTHCSDPLGHPSPDNRCLSVTLSFQVKRKYCWKDEGTASFLNRNHTTPPTFLTLSACCRFYNQQDNDSCIFLFLKGMKLTLLRTTDSQGGRELGREQAYLIEENKQCKSFLNTFSENIVTKTALKGGS